MGPLDYYRQFEGLTQEEVNVQLREGAQKRRELALTRVQGLNLSRTTWPQLPDSRVVNAITYAARRGLHSYPDPQAGALRDELAHRHGLAPRRVVVGNGAAQLLAAAAVVLLDPGQELITPWPSYRLFPLMARRARARAVPVEGFSVDALLSAVTEHTRVLALANPNDPTGEHLPLSERQRLLEALPERVIVLLDEALVDFVDAEDAQSSVSLLEEHSRLLVFRSFSKAWGIAGLRCGYALGGPDSESMLERLEPELGVNELAQAGALEALHCAGATMDARTVSVAAERQRLIPLLRATGLEITESQANFLWAGHPELDGAELASRLERAGVIVASGAILGDRARVRISVRGQTEGDRLLDSLQRALEEE